MINHFGMSGFQAGDLSVVELLLISSSWRLSRTSPTSADSLSIAEGVYSLSLGADRTTLGTSLTQIVLNAISPSPQ